MGIIDTAEKFHEKLRRFHRQYGKLDAEAFAEIFLEPFLVFDLQGVSKAPSDFQAYADTDQADMGTVLEEEDDARALGTFVAQIIKSDRNQVKGKVLLGRGAANDIVIPHPSLSKVHLYFRQNQLGDGYLAFDMRSRYGTVARQKKLQSGKGFPMRSKDVIEFAGSITARFFSPPDFYEYMTIMARSSGGHSQAPPA